MHHKIHVFGLLLTKQADVYFYTGTELQMSSRPKKAKTSSPVMEDDDDFVDTNTLKSMMLGFRQIQCSYIFTCISLFQQ